MTNGDTLSIEIRTKYETNRKLYHSIRKNVREKIKKHFEKNGIRILDIQARVKCLDSLAEKIERKEYTDPFKKITDIIGLRVITYLEEDVETASIEIKNLFEIDEKNCIDFRAHAETDKFGYRSLHLVCNSNECDDQNIPIRFEVQIRTVLQHAWAEIEHGLNYKSEKALPPELKRKMFRLSGLLELADEELLALTHNARKFGDSVDRGEKFALEQELSFLSVSKILQDVAKKAGASYLRAKNVSDAQASKIMSELSKFGVKTNSELKETVTSVDLKSLSNALNERGVSGYLGMMRYILMAANPEKYFDKVYEKQFRSLSTPLRELIERENPDVDVSKILQSQGIGLASLPDQKYTH